MVAVHFESVVLGLCDISQKLDVNRRLVGHLSVLVHWDIVFLQSERSKEIPKLGLDQGGVNVGTPKHLGAWGHLCGSHHVSHLERGIRILGGLSILSRLSAGHIAKDIWIRKSGSINHKSSMFNKVGQLLWRLQNRLRKFHKVCVGSLISVHVAWNLSWGPNHVRPSRRGVRNLGWLTNILTPSR